METKDSLATRLEIPILQELVPSGFEYGQLLLVEYEPDSIWYETSLTITAQSIRNGTRIEYHTYEHIPHEIRAALATLGLNLKQLEEEDKLRILDSYTSQTGLGSPETPTKSKIPVQPLKLSDSSIDFAQHLKAGIPEADKRMLHIDDNFSVMLQYNDEKTVINFGRTRMIPWARARETTYIIPNLKAIASDVYYKQVESIFDGIIDFKTGEKAEQIEQLVRVRLMRRKAYDSRWHRLKLTNQGEVALLD
jgi:KaiC/GvpD/RAD55 family RecA-like ATPase